MRRHPVVHVILLTLAGTAVAAVVVLNVPWLPAEASSQAARVDSLYKALAVASVFIFALVVSLLSVNVVHFRRRFGDQEDGEPIHGHTGIEVLWSVIPAV